MKFEIDIQYGPNREETCAHAAFEAILVEIGPVLLSAACPDW